MKQVPDRKKLRREYLKRKGKLYATSLSLLLYVFGIWAVILFTIRDSSPFLTFMMLVLLIPLAVVYSIIHIGVTRYEAMGMPYVPPATPNTLPADEILVRAAVEPPVAHSEVLLRAAKEQETPKEELLRTPNHSG